jgi:DNA-binding protein H-NS
MAKINLAGMSVEALLQLRDDVGRALAHRAGDLQRQLAALGENVGGGRGQRGRRISAMKGRKVAPKYRGPGGETWAGRGAMPRWLAEAIKEGKTREDFLIQGTAAAKTVRKRSPAKKRRKKK